MQIGKLDEKGGYFFEALVQYCLDHSTPHIHYTMHEKLGNGAPKSDVIIPSKDNPQAVILITHSFSENGTHMKTWRNIDEMLYIRQHFPSCVVIDLLFPSNWKKSLVEIMGAICDAQISFPVNMGETLIRYALQSVSDNAANKIKYAEWIEENKNSLSPIIKYITSEIKKAIKTPIASSWRQYAGSTIHEISCINKYRTDNQYKIALLKLALLTEKQRQIILSCKNYGALDTTFTGYLSGLGILKLGFTPTLDPIVSAFVEESTKESIIHTYKMVDDLFSEVIEKIMQPVYGVNEYDLLKFYNDISNCDKSKRKEYINQSILAWMDNHPSTINLPLFYLYALATCFDKRFSHRILLSHCHGKINSIFKLSGVLNGTTTINTEGLNEVTAYFDQVITLNGIPSIEEITRCNVAQVVTRLNTNNKANYLLYHCISKCTDAGLSIEDLSAPHYNVENGIAEYCRSHGYEVEEDAGETDYSFSIEYKGTRLVFSVIAANAATHKHKEYPARWRCSNIVYKDGSFVSKPQSLRWIVVLDGLWKSMAGDFDDLIERFSSAGASAIYDIATFCSSKDIKHEFDVIVGDK